MKRPPISPTNAFAVLLAEHQHHRGQALEELAQEVLTGAEALGHDAIPLVFASSGAASGRLAAGTVVHFAEGLATMFA